MDEILWCPAFAWLDVCEGPDVRAIGDGDSAFQPTRLRIGGLSVIEILDRRLKAPLPRTCPPAVKVENLVTGEI
jgi:hypothetical protein